MLPYQHKRLRVQDFDFDNGYVTVRTALIRA